MSRFLCKIWFKNGAEMAKISAILFSCHCHCAIIFCFSATAMCTTFFSLVVLKVVQVPSTENRGAHCTVKVRQECNYCTVQIPESHWIHGSALLPGHQTCPVLRQLQLRLQLRVPRSENIIIFVFLM